MTGWAFTLPTEHAPDAAAGLRLTADGRIATVDGAADLRQSILLLLATAPGERVMRPDYGCDLRRLAFSPNDDTTAGLAILYVRSALARWEPRVEVLRLDAARHPDDPTRLDVVLEYRDRTTGRTDRLTAPVALTGGAG
jgi:uncharacterized protein